MAKKKVTLESQAAEIVKLKESLVNQKKYAKQLRDQIETLKLKSGGRGGVHGHELK